LKQSGAVFLQTQGKLAGCWVMRIENGADSVGAELARPDSRPNTGGAELARPDEEIAAGAVRADGERGADDASREKVIVRSNGVVTYVGKDIANQFWKFGLLGRDFNYRRFTIQANGHPLWATTSEQGERSAPSFGCAQRIYNVIDSRQMYL